MIVAVLQVPEIELKQGEVVDLCVCGYGSPSATCTPRLVGQLPAQDARLIYITRDECFDVVLVRILRKTE